VVHGVHGVKVSRPVGALIRRREDPTPTTQHSEDEESNPVRAFATLRRLGLGLVAVSDENPAPSVIRVPHTPAHARNPNGAVPVYGSQKTPVVSIRAEAHFTDALFPTAEVVSHLVDLDRGCRR
jgi:hypothetical protein